MMDIILNWEQLIMFVIYVNTIVKLVLNMKINALLVKEIIEGQIYHYALVNLDFLNQGSKTVLLAHRIVMNAEIVQHA